MENEPGERRERGKGAKEIKERGKGYKMKTRHKSLPLNLNEPFPLVLVVSL
jgi:hypothetical protein